MKRAGIHQIADMAGVSIGTVDRALHGRAGISEATRRRVLRIAKQLSYKPHPAARILSVGRANLRIGVCIPEEIHFFYDQVRAGIYEEVVRIDGLGIEIVYRPVPGLGEGEGEQISGLLAEGVHALIITPGNPKLVTPLIDRAEKQNVRVVCLTTDAAESRRTTFVGVNPELSGRLAAELMSKFIPAGSKVAVITGMLATEEHRLKSRGFQSGFKQECCGGKIADLLEAHESAEESYRKTCGLLSRHPDLQGIYVSTVNCLPVCRALKENKRAGHIRLITSDLFPEMVPYIRRGTIQASIYQDPYLQGQTAVRVLVDFLLHKTEIAETHFLNPGIVLRSNLALFREISGNPASPVRAFESSSL
ncbi:MAG: substrate-binding domain-containing protein [Acidobacteriota bacterium]|jgi:LacI family transcriptional regulator|nr:substrate-binding domain-containing protein [Acidobacteriota bacterium]